MGLLHPSNLTPPKSDFGFSGFDLAAGESPFSGFQKNTPPSHFYSRVADSITIYRLIFKSPLQFKILALRRIF